MKLTGAQIIIETLIEQGVETVFGYPGGTVLDIYDQLYKNSDRIQHIRVSHEQHAAHAADGYSRATGIVCGGPDSALGETAQVRVYVDGELAATLDGVARDGAAQRFEVDITGASTLRFETSRNGEYWENVVYLAGLALE